jgi:glutamate 5-kinase
MSAAAAKPAGDANLDDRFAELRRARRIVIKIGTNTLTRQKGDTGLSGKPRDEGGIDVEYLHRVAEQVAALVKQGKEILIVTSGAIGMGARELGMAKRPTDIDLRQACAAIGQPLLMNEYHRAFGVYGLTVAQILITRDAWDNRASYLNLRKSVDSLLAMKVVPVFNENDTISTAEIGNAFGDNDQLSAYIASKTDAELLMLLSDIDCLYTADPRQDPAATPIRYVAAVSQSIHDAAGDKGSEFSTGGMKTKIKAVEIARDAGCRVVLAHGRAERIIGRIAQGETVGTLFEADQPLKNRIRWIKNARPQGTIWIDEGAMKAIRAKHSLLPKGIVRIDGAFDRNEVVQINHDLKIVSPFSSVELDAIKGRHSAEASAVLAELVATGAIPEGAENLHATLLIARPEDMAWLVE